MNQLHGVDELDGLRLVGLSRIPRCAVCPRFHALAVATGRPAEDATPLPPAPEKCHHQVCSPLVGRYEEDRSERDERPSDPAALRLSASATASHRCR